MDLKHSETVPESATLLSPDIEQRLMKFIEKKDFKKGLLALDLDGTALIEDRGKISIPQSVGSGVKAIHALKQPVVLNTLRFPLSVIWTVGEAWYKIVEQPILTVLLNGSVLGYIKRRGVTLEYEELAAYPLTNEDLGVMIDGISELIRGGIQDILLFFYSQDWRAGETLWTPNPAKVSDLRLKYRSASKVHSGSVEELRGCLAATSIYMASLQIDRPEDTLMAYQHSKRSSFFTKKGVDKASGLREIAKKFDLSLPDSLGAGDTEMDTFLSEVGLALVVGPAKLDYKGHFDTLRIKHPTELGQCIGRFAQLAGQKEKP
ncbi:MAG: hydrolase of the superfamily-like protein [Verrucomicrobiales bacterium]|nr:hydrolase of the superfamily-like protein [Verrucomicrobiales bacterium]